MPVKLLGLDPGANTGAAVYIAGVLSELRTVEPQDIADLLRDLAPERVIYEDSRKESFVWTTKGSRAAALKMARNIGEVDGWCKLIEATCKKLGIPCHGVSPTKKGAKVDAAAFGRITGWTKPSNQHARDAAMTAWPYRKARA